MRLSDFSLICFIGVGGVFGLSSPVLSQERPETIWVGHLLNGRGGERDNVLVTIHKGLITAVDNAPAGTAATFKFDKLTSAEHQFVLERYFECGKLANSVRELIAKIQ